MPEETDGIQAVLDTREAVEKAGMTVHTVSTGGVHNYESAASTGGVTEVPVSAYPLMDYNYCQHLGQFQPAARVVAMIISRPVDEYGIADAGHKATGPDRGLPVIDGIPNAQVTRLSAEHTSVALEGDARKSVKVGDMVRLIPRDLDTCINQYNPTPRGPRRQTGSDLGDRCPRPVRLGKEQSHGRSLQAFPGDPD